MAMGLYRINFPNTIFPGPRGALFRAADGPMVTAAVRSGSVSRMDWEPTTPEQASDQQEQSESGAEATESSSEGETMPEATSKKAKNNGGSDTKA